MSTTLYHGTAEREDDFDCEDLVSGIDGMIHLHPEYDSVQSNYPRVIECQTGVELDDMPTLPDLRDWNPFDMTNEFVRLGVLTPEEAANVTAGVSEDDPARDVDTETLRSEYEDRLQVQDLDTYSVRDLLNMSLEEGYESGEYDEDMDETETDEGMWLKAMDDAEDAQERLFNTLKAKGLTAFKYENEYELGLKGEYSVAVIDQSSLSKPVIATPPIAPEPGDRMAGIREAVSDYSSERQIEQERLQYGQRMGSGLEYRGMPKQPAYTARGGRGDMRY